MRCVPADDVQDAFRGYGFAVERSMRKKFVQGKGASKFTAEPCIKIIAGNAASPSLHFLM